MFFVKRFFLSRVWVMLLLCTTGADLQTFSQPVPNTTAEPRGITIQNADSTVTMTVRFRMQTWLRYSSENPGYGNSHQTGNSSADLTIRKLRLRFNGTLFNPLLSYLLQIELAPSDASGVYNYLRDAMVYWKFNPTLQVGVGRTKLPGERQYLISSGSLEMADRSAVHHYLGLGRETGLHATWNILTGSQGLTLRAAATTALPPQATAGIQRLPAVTGRLEYLPLGRFTGNGDTFEGDLLRERTPKLSVGAAAHAVGIEQRFTGLNSVTYVPESDRAYFADAVFKYSGFALYTEYAVRKQQHAMSENVLLDDLSTGYTVQVSYTTPWHGFVAARFATVNTDAQNVLGETHKALHIETAAATVGCYINGHRIKTSLEVGSYKVNTLDISTQKPFPLYVLLNLETGI